MKHQRKQSSCNYLQYIEFVTGIHLFLAADSILLRNANSPDLGWLNLLKSNAITRGWLQYRCTKAKRIRERKRVLGRSIEERPESVDSREEFGHWEIDEVIGRKSDKDKVLLTMVERKTRNLCVLRLADKSSRSLMEAF